MHPLYLGNIATAQKQTLHSYPLPPRSLLSLLSITLFQSPIMPAADNKFHRLAPAGLHGKSDEEFGVFMKPRSKPQRSSKCLVYFLAALVLLAAVALVFAFAVLRVETPDVELTSVAVKNLTHGSSSSPSFNVTLTAEVSVENKNFGAFNFEDGTARVLYKDMAVGEKNFSSHHVEARKTTRMNVTFDVRSDRLSDDKNLTSDISSGSVNLTNYAQVTGKVRVMKIVRRRTTAIMNCTMTLNLSNGSIQDLVCR